MNLVITFIFCTLINILTNFMIKKVKGLIQILKMKKTFNKFNLPDFQINKDFWEDIKHDDISTD